MLISQRVLIEYQQASAGGPGSQRRAGVPLGMALQATASDTRCIDQELIARGPEFELRVDRTRELQEVPQYLTFLRVTLGVVYFMSGAVFESLPKDLALPLDEHPWVRIRFNRRVRTTDYQTYYEDYVLNVARVAEDFPSDLFLGAPGRIYDFRRELR